MSLLSLLLENDPKIEFECPRTKQTLIVSLPTRDIVHRAHEYSRNIYNSGRLNPSRMGNTLEEKFHAIYLNGLEREYLIANCISYEGIPIGLDTVAKLDDSTITYYGEKLAELEETFRTEPDEWSEEELKQFFDDIKKKSLEQIAEAWNTMPETTRLACILTMVDLLQS